jgi:hypothetical protein
MVHFVFQKVNFAREVLLLGRNGAFKFLFLLVVAFPFIGLDCAAGGFSV